MARIQDEKREKASALADLAKRLYTPRNVSAALLIGEGVLCAAIVCFVACESMRHGPPGLLRCVCGLG